MDLKQRAKQSAPTSKRNTVVNMANVLLALYKQIHSRLVIGKRRC